MEHELIPAGEIHAPHNWVVANEAARLALVVTEADLGKYCWQRDNESQWFLSAHGPATWQPMVTQGELDTQVTLLYIALDDLDAAKIDATEKGAANGVATLGADQKIPESQLPSVAITDVFAVASQAAMLALTAERGDIAVRSDLNKTFALAALPASTLANWLELRTPTDAVLSVAGRTGAITLAKADVGLGNVDNTSDADKPVSTAQAAALTAHTGQSTGAHAASAVSNAPAGNIAATTVQAAINELDSEKQATLVSATNIRTAGGQTLVGSGDAPIVAPETHAATSKTTPVDADELGLSDSAASWGLKKLTFANLKAWIGSLFVSKSGDTMTGPLAQAAGTAALPSYTFSGDTNTGMWSPAADVLAWSTAGAERLRIDTSGNVLVTGGGGLGYGVGAGGTVTQATSKGTNITLNKPSGRITTHNESLAAGATVIFQFSNSTVGMHDTATASVSWGLNNPLFYRVEMFSYGIAPGALLVKLTNTHTADLAEEVHINFAVVKGAAS